MIDADGTYPVEALVDLIPMLAQHPVLVGDRLQGPLEPSSMSPLNFLGNRFLSAVASVVHRTDAADVCSGCWVMRRAVVERLRLNSLGFELEAELFASLAAMGHPPTWVRIPYRARKGEAKLTSILDGVRILRKLIVRRVMEARKRTFDAPWRDPHLRRAFRMHGAVVLGASGLVGQRLQQRLANHPMFDLVRWPDLNVQLERTLQNCCGVLKAMRLR